MKKSGLVSKLKATGLATALSVLPAKEVDSGVSYGGNVGIGFNGDLSIGAQVLTSNKAKNIIGKLGLDFILTGRDRGELGTSIGVGYLFPRGITSTIEGRYNPKSESPLSLGFGLGYGNVKKNGGDGNGVGRGECHIDFGGEVLAGEIDCKNKCISTGGTWTDEGCECPEGTAWLAGGTCYKP